MGKPVFLVLLLINFLNIKVHCAKEENGNGNPIQKGCGWQNGGGIGITTQSDFGGDDGVSKFGEFPWMVAILKLQKPSENDKPLHLYLGGASLIHPSVVLTAAHKLDSTDPEGLKIRAGEWDTQTTRELYPHQDRDIESVVIHENYSKSNLSHDIALLFLSTPVELAPNVGFACLPPSQRRARPGDNCLSLGWGKDKFGKGGHYSQILKKVSTPVVSREVCQDKFRSTRLGSWFELDPTFMCAGEQGKYTCKGDGGSPLICASKTSGRWIQNGITLWSIGCSGDPPSVYSDVGVLREWVDGKVREKGYQTDTYTDYDESELF